MKPLPRLRSGASALLLTLCLGGVAFAAPISGAIFTSDIDGTVNVNHYAAKADVYLNGGPTNDNCDAAAVDDGVYVFQITNPSGTVLLSEDDISQREFTVSGGVIVSANNHAVTPADCGGVRVQMIPFADTPNNGGVYKAWITRKSDYIANGNTFRNSDTKTDNFHVLVPTAPELSALNVYKFYDANANGEWDADEVPLFGWLMTAANGFGFAAQQLTQSPDGLTRFDNLSSLENPYAVQEGTAGGTWHQSALIIDGAPQAVANPATGINLVAGETTEVIFGNYCECKAGGKPKSWWVTASGQTKVNDGSTMNPEFNALNQLNLRSSSGSGWNLNTTTTSQATNWNLFLTWVNNTSTNNMAYALSRSAAILRLNIDAGYVVGTNLHHGSGMTISALLSAANTTLGADGSTPLGDEPNRATQEQLRTWIDEINNNTVMVIMPKPCKFAFYLPPPG
ncbi:hypothetical protein LK996_10340 [Lysobacter sp. A6]|uniref:Uncharacterized protein n=1 Tax=Noviluteimonas lactosilytica TaxID=2888523 RepID=A0ABS8JIP6_9GAMM|nr:hypothetical protein [Lysobacter lactosilyticus]MCC8363471.1 hypothetical protein [Lysobacter lactosilyticus]